MWRGNAVLVALLLTHEFAANSSAQPPSTSLLSQSRWARFELVLGRVITLPAQCGQSRLTKTSGSSDEVQETLSFNGDTPLASLDYERVDKLRSLQIQAVGRSQLAIRSEPHPGTSSPTVSLSQTRLGDVTLTIGQPGAEQSFEAASLWHLLLAEPEACRQHVVPLLEIMRPDWELLEAAEQIEAEICQRTGTEALSRQRALALVSRLDSPSFTARRAADRELRALGVRVLPYLEELDTSRLSGEQRMRVRRLRNELKTLTPDTPQRIAAWLQHDESVWRNWLANPSRREAAARGLARIHGDPEPTPSRIVRRP